MDLKKLNETKEIGPVENKDYDALLLSPIRRKAYAKRYVAHKITNTFMVADYDIDAHSKHGKILDN